MHFLAALVAVVAVMAQDFPAGCTTTGGTVTAGTSCVFPFEWSGTTYYGCTTDSHSTYWCGTESGTYKGKWGNCAMDKCFSKIDARCSTTAGSVAVGTKCVFPFTYGGKTYHGCTKDAHSTFWCSTTPGTYSGKWGNCVMTTCAAACQNLPTPNPADGHFDTALCKNVKLSDSCPLICDAGYEPTGSATCRTQNAFMKPYPTCRPKSCAAAPTPPVTGATYKCAATEGAVHDAMCELSCPSGQVKTGDARCLYGTWSTPTCHPPSVKVPTPVGKWSFADGKDDMGNHADLTLAAGATYSSGALNLGGTNYAWTPLAKNVNAKTLFAFVKLSTLEQGGGAAMTIDSDYSSTGAYTHVKFDAIVYNEVKAEWKAWIAGSEFYKRTKIDSAMSTAETSTSDYVSIAITYALDGTIQMYRNGSPYGASFKKAAGVSYSPSAARIIFGIRHSGAGGLKGTVDDACLFNQALSAEQVAYVHTNKCVVENRDCTEAPENPENGEYADCSDVESGKTCALSCRPGYLKGGDAVCNNTKWKLPPTGCTPKNCTGLPVVENAEAFPASCNPTVHGEMCALKCKVGYIGTSNPVCNHGTWSSVTCEDVCERLKCKDSPEPCLTTACSKTEKKCVTSNLKDNTTCNVIGKCFSGSCLTKSVTCTCNEGLADGFTDCGMAVCKTKSGELLGSFSMTKGFNPEVEFGYGTYSATGRTLSTHDGKWKCEW